MVTSGYRDQVTLVLLKVRPRSSSGRFLHTWANHLVKKVGQCRGQRDTVADPLSQTHVGSDPSSTSV